MLWKIHEITCSPEILIFAHMRILIEILIFKEDPSPQVVKDKNLWMRLNTKIWMEGVHGQ